MAKKVTGYYAVVDTDSYFRPEPSFSLSGATRVYAGHEFVIYVKDGAPYLSGEFYRSNEGYIYYGDVTITGEVYETTTDACKAPTSVALTGNTLTISGGAGGDLNNFAGYGISWRDAPIGTSSYGGWSADVVVSGGTTATYKVGAPAGYVRQFRVRTRGSAGEAYYSAYVVCATTLSGNRAPNAPFIRKPDADATTFHASPSIVVDCDEDPDGDALTLYRQIDGGDWTVVSSSAVGTTYDQLPALSPGRHTVGYKLKDPYSESSVSSKDFIVAEFEWGRTINTGTVISNMYISHRADIAEMLEAVNTQRAFYGLGGVTLPDVGRFKSWASCMRTLLDGINACRTFGGLSATEVDIPDYPSAFVVNTIRSLTTGASAGSAGDAQNKLDSAVLDQMILT